jgi:hypothetical protein
VTICGCDESTTVIIDETSIEVIDLTETIEVIETAEQGPPGPVGPIGPAGGAALSKIAGENLSGQRIVVLRDNLAYYADPTDLADVAVLTGMTLGAAIEGTSVNIQSAGEIVEPSWNWVADMPIYLGLGGTMTQAQPTFPAMAYSAIVGFPTSSTSVMLSFREPIALA